MKELIKKYAVLIILVKIVTALIPAILITLFPKLLTFELPNGNIETYGITYLSMPISYLFNFIIAAFIFNDMKKLNINSIAIFILTCLASLSGIIIFLFVSFQNNLPKHEKSTD